MKISRIGWTLWALVPVGVLAYHFGPGQQAYRADLAATLVVRAQTAQDDAMALQEHAYAAHLEAIAARAAAFGNEDATLVTAAKTAGVKEDEAYAAAAKAWGATATILNEAQALVDASGGASGGGGLASHAQQIRLARARATVRTGDIAAGATELEDLLETLNTDESRDSELATQTREELATAYYYSARLMRLAGKPAGEWREISGRARQNYRYLAEQARADGASNETIANHEKNGELVLDLEQSSVEQIFLKPKPKDCPGGNCNNPGTKPCKKPGKSKGDKPAKGAGMNGEIGDGW